jgi:hypothetical protein
MYEVNICSWQRGYAINEPGNSTSFFIFEVNAGIFRNSD